MSCRGQVYYQLLENLPKNTNIRPYKGHIYTFMFSIFFLGGGGGGLKQIVV